MQLLALGLNHETAPIELREKAAFGPETMGPALSDLASSDVASEATILSTCNRTEIYCGNQQLDQTRIVHWLSDFGGFKREELVNCLYMYPNEQAVKHAFRVASGLDSMVLGEPQILGQMKAAFDQALQAGTTGKVLNRLFQHTFTVAKQVRTDTSIGSNPVSVAYAGVSLASRIFTSLSEQTVLLIGAGETIELVARHLKEKKVKRMIVANRSIERAKTLAEEVGCEAITLAQIPDNLPNADILVSSTASTLPILGKGAVEGAIKKRKHRPMFILDLAVPRDVEPEVADLTDVYLYTVDDLKSVVEQNRGMREQAAKEAENIIDLQVVRFMRWMRSLESEPTIKNFRNQIESIRQSELEKAQAKIARGDDPNKVLEQLARDLSNKFAHHPSQQLKQADIEGNPGLVSAARKLFGL
jgi:glutamyl-tRNA reductase